MQNLCVMFVRVVFVNCHVAPSIIEYATRPHVDVGYVGGGSLVYTRGLDVGNRLGPP